MSDELFSSLLPAIWPAKQNMPLVDNIKVRAVAAPDKSLNPEDLYVSKRVEAPVDQVQIAQLPTKVEADGASLSLITEQDRIATRDNTTTYAATMKLPGVRAKFTPKVTVEVDVVAKTDDSVELGIRPASRVPRKYADVAQSIVNELAERVTKERAA